MKKSKYYDFLKLINLNLHRYFYLLYNLIIPALRKMRIHMIIRNGSLRHRINLLFIKALHFGLPDTIETGGVTLYHRSLDGGAGLFGWCYAFNVEPEALSIIKQTVKPGMTAVDVGAYIGYYALHFAKLVGNKGRVFAFEPAPSVYTLLKKNIEVNKLNAIIESFDAAVGDREKRSTLFLGMSTDSSLFRIFKVIDRPSVTIDVISLDKFFADRNWPPVHIIKIDTEGSEKFVLEGMRKLVTRNQELKLIIELNPFFLEAADTCPEDLLILLGELGFNRIRILLGKIQFYKIPQDIRYLVDIARRRGFVNLFCEKR